MRSLKNVSGSSMFSWFILAAAISFLLGAAIAQAGDAKGLLKQFNSEIRKTQNDMFAGKNDKAIANLEQLRGLLGQIEAADPNNPQLKAAQSKYTKLVKDLERKTGQDLKAGTTTAKAASSPAKLPSSPEVKPMPDKAPVATTSSVVSAATDSATGPAATASPPASAAATPAPAPTTASSAAPAITQTAKASSSSAKLPYDARKPLQTAENSLRSVNRYIRNLTDPNYGGDKQQVVSNASKALESAKQSLKQAKQKAAEKGVTSHPKFDQVQADIDNAEKQLAAAMGQHEKTQAQAAASAGEVTVDVQNLKEIYKKNLPVFEKATGNVPHYSDLKPMKELLVVIEDFEQNNQDGCKRTLDAFAAKYGSTREEIDKKAEALGYNGEGRASFPYTETANGIENVKKTRVVVADDLIRKAKDMQSRAGKGVGDFAVVGYCGTIKEWGELALQFDPQNPRVKEFMSGIDPWIKERTDALNAKIDKQTWPKQAANAPGDAAKLAKIAKDFCQAQADADAAKGKESRTMLAVVVTGPWRIFKTNLLKEPVQYALPVLLAEQWESEKDKGLARVYEMSMLTDEYKGVKQAPPFIGAAVGNNFYIRPGKIK